MHFSRFLYIFAFAIVSIVADEPSTFVSKWYAVTSDCGLHVNSNATALLGALSKIKNLPVEKPCENITSTYFEALTGSYIIFVKYESETELSIGILPAASIENVKKLDASNLKKVNFDDLLGDNCNFEVSLLSAGVDADTLYIPLNCNDSWAFLRLVLYPSFGEVFTPTGPLIYFQKNDDYFERILFVPAHHNINEEKPFLDAIILRYDADETADHLSYRGTYLHQLNETDSKLSNWEKGTAGMNLFSTSSKLILSWKVNGSNTFESHLYVDVKGSDDAVITDLTNLLDNSRYQVKVETKEAVSKDAIATFGFAPVFTPTGKEISTWKIRDRVAAKNTVVVNNCPEQKDVSNPQKTETAASTSSPDCGKNEHGFILLTLYIVAGVEVLFLVGTIIAFIICIVLKRKKKSNIVTKREGQTYITTKLD